MREPTQTRTPQPPSRGHHGRESLAGDEAQSRSQEAMHATCALWGAGPRAQLLKAASPSPFGPPGRASPVPEPERPRPRLPPAIPTNASPPSPGNSCPHFPPLPSPSPGVFLR